MKPVRIRLLALDLDGTVLDDEKHITPATRRALEDAIAAGVTVLPASGRPLSGISREFLDIPGVNYAICANGALVCRLSDGAKLHEDNLEDGVAMALLEELGRLNIITSFFLEGKSYLPARQYDLMDQLSVSPGVLAYLRASRIPVEHPAELVRARGGVQKFSLGFVHEADGRWRDGDRVRAILARYPALTVVSGGVDNLEITAPTAHKGAALRALGEQLGIPREETMACGDSGNDLEMIRYAGWGVAMANSEPEVLAVADAVTASNQEDGVALAIRRYILGEK